MDISSCLLEDFSAFKEAVIKYSVQLVEMGYPIKTLAHSSRDDVGLLVEYFDMASSRYRRIKSFRCLDAKADIFSFGTYIDEYLLDIGAILENYYGSHHEYTLEYTDGYGSPREWVMKGDLATVTLVCIRTGAMIVKDRSCLG
jgi:hypothetical protein